LFMIAKSPSIFVEYYDTAELSRCHAKYVVVAVVKASNNIACTWKA